MNNSAMTRVKYFLPLFVYVAQVHAQESVVPELINLFESTKTIDEFKTAYRVLTHRNEEITAANYEQFLQQSIDVATMYQQQVEFAQIQIADTSYNRPMVREGVISACLGLYGLSRLPVARYMPHNWWVRLPWFPFSRLITAIGFYNSTGYKLVIGLELLGGLTGIFGLYQGIQIIKAGRNYKQFLNQQQKHIQAIIAYLQHEQRQGQLFEQSELH